MLQKANRCIKCSTCFDNEKDPSFWLSFPYVLGLVFGVLCASSVDITAGIRFCKISAISLPGLILVSSLPFVLSWVLCWIGGPETLVPIVFMEAFCTSFLFGVLLRSSAAGWVLRLIPCFLDFLRLPALIPFWGSLYRNCLGPKSLISSVLYLSLICTVFYYVISPFWVQLLLFYP